MVRKMQDKLPCLIKFLVDEIGKLSSMSPMPPNNLLSGPYDVLPFPPQRTAECPLAVPELVKGQNLRDDCQTFICIRERGRKG